LDKTFVQRIAKNFKKLYLAEILNSMFKGKKISLRQMEIADVEHLYEWENNPENWIYGNTLNPYSRFFLEQYVLSSQNDILQDKQLRLVIFENSGDPCGAIDLFDFDAQNKRAAVGILVKAEKQGRGYALEALKLLVNYCKKTLNLKQLYCSIEVGNDKSLNLFKKAGFEVTGVLKKWKWVNGKWIDENFLQKML
jgi:diamine N-acetyltransferase